MRSSIFIGLIAVVFLPAWWSPLHAQTTAVLTGQVTDASTAEPMPFAHVYINGSTRGAVTDEKGNYMLAGIPLGTVEIAASFVGYQSVTQKIRFENASSQKANFQLKPSEQMLDAVTVRGNPKGWERHLRQFKKQLFGEPFGNQCVLVNAEVLDFKEQKDHLYATASEPLVIDNQALGYRLIYALQHFDAVASGEVYFAGSARFEELKPENERQADRFRRNRLNAYHGSTRHLMASLIDNTIEQAGFMVYQEDPAKPVPVDRRVVTLAAAVGDYKRLVPVEVSRLIQPGRLSTERRLVSNRKLIVFYTKKTSSFSPYPDARYAYTEIRLPAGQLQMSASGVITIPEGMEAKGSMGIDRLSTLLPAEWKPDGNESAQLTNSSLITQGTLAPPDAHLGRIASASDARFKLLAPTAFLHIDKPFYATGDRLWLSAYLLDAASHQRIEGETALHVDLLTPAGKQVQHQWIRITDGRGQGHFRLSDTLTTGTYRLRAYTDEDRGQRGPAFERFVSVYNLFRNEIAVSGDFVSQPMDIQILPEGGRWISGLRARLGIKIVQSSGKGLAIDGRIADDQGNEIVRFKTNQRGMTSVSMTPQAGRTYHAEVSYQNRRQQVTLVKQETGGLTLSADATSDSTLLALAVMSASKNASDSAYILVQQRGQIIDQRKLILQNGVAKINLPMTGWLPGLTQVTLYDAGATPQAERLIFVPEFVAPATAMFKLNKTKFQPREEVVLSIHIKDKGSPAAAALSASVTDVGKVPDDSTGASMPTHLLLTGELRGRIENPDEYVVNPTAATRRALDDLLLTQGWRRISGTPEADSLGGISLSGHVWNSKKEPIPRAQITLTSTAAGKSFVKSVDANDEGYFRLAGLSVSDTLQLMAQIADNKSKKYTVKDASLEVEWPGKGWDVYKMNVMPDWSSLQTQVQAARVRQEANTDLYRDKNAQSLNEVTVRAQKPNERPDDIKMRSLHTDADAAVTFNEKSPAYNNLYEMLQGRFAGVTVVRNTPRPGGPPAPPGYTVFIRGMNSYKNGTQPMYLVDGVPVQDPDGTMLMNFNPRDIERIEVLKNAGTTGIYGVRGGNGVIAFYTKRARSMQTGANPLSFMTPVQLIGYPSVQRDFYVPRYDTETISGTVDDRDVLYWKPLMQTNNQGQTQLRFPLSDKVRTLRVVVQGVTAEGRPVLGVQMLQVQ